MAENYFLTGCASGMARHLTDVLCKRGDRVYATDLNYDALRETAQSLGWPEDRVRIAALNVTDAAAWEQVFGDAVAAWGGIDVAMNIAGLLLASWAHESPIREIDAQVDVNVKGVIFGTRTAARHMITRGKGHIINIASIAGVTPVPGLSVYAATKHAVRAYSLSAAMELRPKGVYVTAICPATVQTPMLDNQVKNDAAELFFSGWRILTLKDIEDAVLRRALTRRPLEVHVPRAKLKMVQLMGVFPWIGPLVMPLYQRSGRKRQEQRR